MTIDMINLIELILVVLTLKLIVSRWQPPIQESKQAIFCIAIGTTIGWFINPTKEGIVYGIISSGIAFYGGDLLGSFKSIREEIMEINEKGQ